jgi:hypothetical protein
MKTIISILSDQLIPNLLFIRQMGQRGDNHIFLTTKKMEENFKSSILADALELKEGEYEKITIDPNSPEKILQQLKQYHWDKGAAYIVNITGGTKMMSQMTSNFFQEFPKSKIYYWPIEFNYAEQLYPALQEVHFQQQTRLDLKSYLAAHGYSYHSQQALSNSFNRADELYTMVCKAGDAGRVKNIVNAQATEYIKRDKNYLIGGWFEEWIYEILKATLHLKDDEIGFNVKLKSRFSKKNFESDNEIDVAFVYKNVLYIVECKVYNVKQINIKKITDAIYKISSIRQSMGLRATALVAILSPFGDNAQRKETIDYLSKMTQVRKVFSLETMCNKEQFIQEIKKIVRYE